MKDFLEKINNVIENGKYKDSWESLHQYEVPKWYRNARFGIFIHWGVYSVPAFGSEWYSRNMYIRGSREYKHHIETYGLHKDFGYKDFVPMFKAEKFDPADWAELFKNAGAEYVMPVAEHHDGFQMYDSSLSEWNAKQKGPHRDILGELFKEFDKKGLIGCASSHRVEHWFFMGHGREFESDVKGEMKRGDFYWPAMPERDHYDFNSEPPPSKEYLEDWLCRCCEIVDKYRPKMIYFDWWIQHSAVKPYLKRFAAYYYNTVEGAVINYKHDAFKFGTAVIDIERGQFSEAKPFIWQSDTAVAINSWCYTKNNKYKKPYAIVRDLVDIVSKNGRLLLNIGPKADGTIPDEDREILMAIGDWLRVNGEAIYGAKVWKRSSEGPAIMIDGGFADAEEKVFTNEDFRFTAKGPALYAICMNMKGKNKALIRSLASREPGKDAFYSDNIGSVTQLGSNDAVNWSRTEEGLLITTKQIETEMPVVFKIC
ncbi:MAG: alpha-L-fucosidase [Clostridia bacterium]|nr:alpha-L-fucosidase [Clostridia bacterium]